MGWFRGDDKLPGHRKTRRALRGHPTKRRDAGAMGLWVLAGTWSRGNNTDGFVPEEELDRWDDDWEALSERLVDAGFWVPAEVDGEPGFRFVNWSQWNPDAASVVAKQLAESEGGQRGNHQRWHVNRSLIDPSCEFCIPPNRVPDSGPDQGGDLPPNPSVPSHPIPTQSVRARAIAAGLTDDDLDVINSKTGGDAAYAARIALDILGRASSAPRKPKAYVLRAIAEDPERYRKARGNTKADQCPTHPGSLAGNCGGCAADARAAR